MKENTYNLTQHVYHTRPHTAGMSNGLLGALKITKKAANTQIHQCVNRDTECVTREDAGHTHTQINFTRT